MRSDQDQIVDELLVIEAQLGDRACLDLLVDRWSGRLLGAARRHTGDGAAAEEVSQEAWGAIAKGLSRLRDPALFGAWAHGIVRRKAADWVAARGRERRETARTRGAEPRGGSAGIRADGEELVGLRRAIRRLPAERRAILFLLYGEGLSVGQIASLLEVPAGTVKSRLHQARAELRGLLETQGEW